MLEVGNYCYIKNSKKLWLIVAKKNDWLKIQTRQNKHKIEKIISKIDITEIIEN